MGFRFGVRVKFRVETILCKFSSAELYINFFFFLWFPGFILGVVCCIYAHIYFAVKIGEIRRPILACISQIKDAFLTNPSPGKMPISSFSLSLVDAVPYVRRTTVCHTNDFPVIRRARFVRIIFFFSIYVPCPAGISIRETTV